MNTISPIRALAKNPTIRRQVSNMVDNPGRWNGFQKHVGNVAGLVVGGFYVWNTAKSKDIPHARKVTLNINNIITTAVGFIGTYALTNIVDKPIDILKDSFPKAVEHLPNRKSLVSGFGILAPLIIASFVYRYLSPVLATPLSEGVNKFLIKHKMIQDPNEAKTQKK